MADDVAEDRADCRGDFYARLDDARTAADIKASVVDVAVAPTGSSGDAAQLRRGATSVEHNQDGQRERRADENRGRSSRSLGGGTRRPRRRAIMHRVTLGRRAA